MPPLSRIAVVAALTIALLAGCRPAPTPTARTIDLLGDSITWQAYWGRTRTFEGQGRPPGSSRRRRRIGRRWAEGSVW